ncbi:MAG: galactose-1-phosphate uridylyltransferase [Nanoarchaeota archaeon]
MEVRKDYILDRYVYYAPERSKRVKEFQKARSVNKGLCFFCPGNEKTTPPEIGRIENNGVWIIRWFLNKFPIVEDKKGNSKKTKILFKGPAYGIHEVIVETQYHEKQLWDLSKNHIQKILEVYKNRVNELSKVKKIKYIDIFKNHGILAGTSLVHSHSQVVALDKIPPLVKEEINALKRYKKCPYCNIIKAELKTKRKCFENETMGAIAPYASRFNFEVWIFPKRHVQNITDLNEFETDDLADILKKILLKLKKFNIDYNFYLHSGDKDFHFHIEVCPRIATWAGFELSTNMIVNSVTPESAAEFYIN